MPALTRNHHILVDSNIIEYLLSNNQQLSDQVKNTLLSLKGQALNKLYVSHFSYFEILRGIDDDKKKIKAKEVLRSFQKLEITEERLNRAIRLYNKYRKREETKNHFNSTKQHEGDILIGSLIFTESNPILLTANRHDFPAPFFHEVDTERIEYTQRDCKKSIFLYYLKGDLQEFSS